MPPLVFSKSTVEYCRAHLKEASDPEITHGQEKSIPNMSMFKHQNKHKKI
jgi:hypothetical protein